MFKTHSILRFVALSSAVVVLPLVSAGVSPVRAQEVDVEKLIDSFEGVFGKHAGKRRSGAKGVCASGEFTATGAGAALTKAVNFQPGFKASVVARFSNGGGSPGAADNAPAVRGLSLSMSLPSGEMHEFVLINTPVFTAKTPESMMRFLQARFPAPGTTAPDAAKVQAANAANPDWTPQLAYLRDNAPPASFATAPYFGVNSFVLTNSAGAKQHVRWTFEPVGGRLGLTQEERQAKGANFLQAELRERVTKSPVEWRVLIQIPEAGDALTDATSAWPVDRKTIEVGRLSIKDVAADGTPGGCDTAMFNPLNLPTGIDASDDPILQVRAAAYAVSLTRRSAP